MTEPLRKVMKRARDIWDVRTHKIVWKQHMLREPRERVRALMADEERRLFEVLPPSADERDLLFPLQGRHPDRVFAYDNGQPITVHGLGAAWGRALAKAGIENFRFHDLRHTAATRLLRSSGNLKMVQRLLRHEDLTTTGKYAHVLDEDLRDALDDMVRAPRTPRTRRGRAPRCRGALRT